MTTQTTKRKTSVTLDETTLDAARDLGLNVSAIAEAAVRRAVADARRQKWLDDNAQAFALQAEWHESKGHPLADILISPGKASWSA